MTVGELIEELRGWDQSMEVYVSLTDDNGDLLDAPAREATVSLGRVFIGGDDD